MFLLTSHLQIGVAVLLEVYTTGMRRRDLPGIANLHHGVLRLSLGYVFRTLVFLLLFLPDSPVVCAVRLGAPLWLRPGAAQGGSRGDVQPRTLTHRRGLPPLREEPPARNKVHT